MAEKIIFGTEFEFASGLGAGYMDLALLNDDKFVVVYRDKDNSDYGKAKIGTVSGTTITFGNETELNTDGFTNWLSVSPLSTSGFVVTYQDGGDSNQGKVRVGTISGTTITFGAEAEFSNADTIHEAVECFSPSGFVVIGKQVPDDRGIVKVGAVSGTDITFGAEKEFNGSITYPAVSILESNKFVIAFKDITEPFDRGKAVIGEISGTTITLGDEAPFTDRYIDYTAICTINANKFIVAYRHGFDSDHGTANVGTISGTTITFGAETEFLSVGAARQINLLTISENQFIVTFRDGSDSDHGTAKIGTIDGTIITFGEEFEYNVASSYYNPTILLDASRFVVAYMDADDADHGTAKIGTLSPIVISTSGDLFAKGHISTSGSHDLFVSGVITISGFNTSSNLYTQGIDTLTTSGDLFLEGCLDSSTSGDLFIGGHKTTQISGDLFIRGIINAPPDETQARPLDWLLKAPDHYPQIIGTFNTIASIVTMQLWDVTNGQNTLVSVASSGCYQIGDTGRWAWSTIYLPTLQGNAKHYFYTMTSDAAETFEGQFLWDAPEGAKWIHPSNYSDYLV